MTSTDDLLRELSRQVVDLHDEVENLRVEVALALAVLDEVLTIARKLLGDGARPSR